MPKALELTGQRFGKITVLKKIENGKKGKSYWLCKCDCRDIVKVRGDNLNSGNTKSCGCPSKKTHLGKEKRYINGVQRGAYNTWLSMLQRCNNPKIHNYSNYGARGIKVCERWTVFDNFLEDMGERPQGLTIERKDNNKGYSPENCYWATYTQQNRNNRNTKLNPLKVQVIKKLLKESRLTQTDIAKIFYVTPTTIHTIKTGKYWSDIT